MFTSIKNQREQEKREAELKKEAEEEKKRRTEEFRPPVNDLDGGDFVQTWNVVLDEETTTVVIHRNNLKVHVNGEVVLSSIRSSTVDTFGPVISFMIGDHMAQITSSVSSHLPKDMAYTLIVDGRFVPDASSNCDMEERF